MSFWGFITLLLLIGIIIGALYIAKKATNKELELQRRRMRIREIRGELADIDELLQSLLLYDRDVNLLYKLVERIENDIAEGLDLIPNSTDLLDEKAAIEQTRAKIAALEENPQEPDIPASDRQIFLMKRHFSQTLKLLREFYQKGDISEESFRNHRGRLVINTVLLEYKAFVRQGNDARDHNDLAMAANFYKCAKDILLKTDVNVPDKNAEVKKVSNAISGLYTSQSADD
ncbi:hypothetical protein KO489_05025 [Reinekea forsetii]|nr:hypothetical protein [Reinekea forsetii]